MTMSMSWIRARCKVVAAVACACCCWIPDAVDLGNDTAFLTRTPPIGLDLGRGKDETLLAGEAGEAGEACADATAFADFRGNESLVLGGILRARARKLPEGCRAAGVWAGVDSHDESIPAQIDCFVT